MGLHDKVRIINVDIAIIKFITSDKILKNLNT